MFETLKYEVKNNIGFITIDRPEALNAISMTVLKELHSVFEQVNDDPEVKVAILTGNGKAFVAGADIAQMSQLTGVEGHDMIKYGAGVMDLIEAIDKPVIAAVNGFALGGGCELAMACDIRIASEKAKFGQPEVGLGITPGFSGTQRLPRRVGAAMAKELIFSGKMISAVEAERIGLANHVYPADELMDKAMEMAEAFAKNAQIAVRYSKACIDRGMETGIDEGIAMENELFAMCFATGDQKEGMKAFLEKRPASFENK